MSQNKQQNKQTKSRTEKSTTQGGALETGHKFFRRHSTISVGTRANTTPPTATPGKQIKNRRSATG
jgi:hypothetical protein